MQKLKEIKARQEVKGEDVTQKTASEVLKYLHKTYFNEIIGADYEKNKTTVMILAKCGPNITSYNIEQSGKTNY